MTFFKKLSLLHSKRYFWYPANSNIWQMQIFVRVIFPIIHFLTLPHFNSHNRQNISSDVSEHHNIVDHAMQCLVLRGGGQHKDYKLRLSNLIKRLKDKGTEQMKLVLAQSSIFRKSLKDVTRFADQREEEN